MERLHMIVDVSHLSDKGFWDIVEHGTRPLRPATPTAVPCRPTHRNLTDEMIRALAERGGIAGLNYCASFVDADSAHPELCRSTVELMAKHAAHFKQVGGIEVISLGSDFDGIGGHHELETAAYTAAAGRGPAQRGLYRGRGGGDLSAATPRAFFKNNL